VEIGELDPFDDAALEAWYEVYRAALTEGRDYHSAYAFEEVRGALRSSTPSERHRPLLARLGGEVVGVVGTWIPQPENRSMLQLQVCVRPDRWGEGIGSALLAATERMAHEEGRTVLVGEAAYPYEAPVDGSGTRAAEFARRHGFGFGLGDVQRVLDLPVPAGLLQELVTRAAPRHHGYTFRQFSGSAPDELVPGLAEMRGAVATEAPTGDIARERGTVDLHAFRADEAALSQQGRTRYTTVAFGPEGSMAGYTDLVVPRFDPTWVYQWGTLVWSGHRGHRLGLALKARNVAFLQRELPDRKAIRTWNAVVNSTWSP
jgi:GNAT superfamily N-acetyltransferase